MDKILIVEDEENLGITLQEYLSGKGYDVRLSQTIKDSKDQFKKFNPDIVLMDIGLPDGSGLDLARELRAENPNLLLLFLSALNDPDTKLAGFEIGAEDYITKPFALKELTLRLQKSLQFKREIKESLKDCVHGPLKIWFERFQVEDANGTIIDLGQKECAILRELYSNQGKAHSREALIEKIWGGDKFPSNRTVDNYIVKLRRWCETDPQKNIEIQSIRGIGYKLIIKE